MRRAATMPPRCTTLVVDTEDQATRPLAGHVVIEADSPGAIDVDVVLSVRAAGPSLSLVEEVARVELRGAAIAAGTTGLPFRLPAQRRGWSHDHPPFRTSWQLEAGPAGGAPTVCLPLAQSPPRDAPAVVTPHVPARLELVETRHFGPVVILGGAAAVLLATAAAFTLVWSVPTVALLAIAPTLLLIAPLARAIRLLRQQGRLGTPQFAVGDAPGSAAGAAVPCTVWLHPRAAVAAVDLAVVVRWDEVFKPDHARASPRRHHAAVDEHAAAATLVEPGRWRAVLTLPSPATAPPPLHLTGDHVERTLTVTWHLEARVRLDDGTLETVPCPLAVDLPGIDLPLAAAAR